MRLEKDISQIEMSEIWQILLILAFQAKKGVLCKEDPEDNVSTTTESKNVAAEAASSLETDATHGWKLG